MQAFIVSSLHKFVKNVHSSDDAALDCIYVNCASNNLMFKSNDIRAIAEALHASQSPLEFKVNQEIFGKNPDSRFHSILEFWLYYAFLTIDEFKCFLKKFHKFGEFPMHNDISVILRISKEISNVSYEDYYRTLEYLERFEEDEVIHELSIINLSIINSSKYDDDDMHEVAKVDDDYGIDDLLRNIDLD